MLPETVNAPAAEPPARVLAAYAVHLAGSGRGNVAYDRYIEGWYNTERIQARLGWRSPDEYEAAWQADRADNPATEHAEPEPAAAR